MKLAGSFLALVLTLLVAATLLSSAAYILTRGENPVVHTTRTVAPPELRRLIDEHVPVPTSPKRPAPRKTGARR